MQKTDLTTLNQNSQSVIFSALSLEKIHQEIPVREDVLSIYPKGLIDGWHVIGIEESNNTTYLLLGINLVANHVWCTSPILFISPERHAVLTRSGSVYAMDQMGAGEPSTELVAHLVRTLQQWGNTEMVSHMVLPPG